MKLIRTILAEAFGLFVDDGSLALAILALVAVVALLALRSSLAHWLVGGGLALGALAILGENVFRAARRSGR